MRRHWFCARCHYLNPVAEEKCPTIGCQGTRREFESVIKSLTLKQFFGVR